MRLWNSFALRGVIAALVVVVGVTAPAFAGTNMANLTLLKSDNPDPVVAGGDILYTITLTNQGPNNADNVQLIDQMSPSTTFNGLLPPAGWACVLPSVGTSGPLSCSTATLTPGTVQFLLSVHVPTGVTGSVTNQADVVSTTVDPDTSDNQAIEPTTVASSADLLIQKSGAPDPVAPDSDLTYTIGIANSGPSDAVNVTVSDVVPAQTTFVSVTPAAGFTCGTTPAVGGTGTVSCTAPSLPPGGPLFFTLVVHVSPAAAGVISNTATIGSDTADSNTNNNTFTTTNTVSTTADVSLTKSDSPDPVVAGSNITYTIPVSNGGPNSGAAVTVTDVVPTGTTFVSVTAPAGWSCTAPASGGTGTVTCSNPVLVNGATDTLTLVVNVNPSTTGTITNTANVSTTSTDLAAGNNSATATTTVNTSADLTVTKTASPDPVTAGQQLTYTINVTNNGPSDAQTVQLSDTLPAGTTFVSFTAPAGWSTTAPAVGGTGAVTASIATLPPGTAGPFTLVVTVTNAAANPTLNSATVTSPTDTNAGNNAGNSSTAVVPPSADLTITKTAGSGPFSPGAPISYTITVTNNGTADATNVSVVDTLPVGSTFVMATPSTGSCSGGPSPITCSLGTLTASSSATITLVVTAPATPGTVSNVATVSATETDPNPTDNTATATVNTSLAIPTLSQWALIALAAMLACLGALALKSS